MPRSENSSEIEIKIRVPEETLDASRKKLLNNGFSISSPRNLETNTLFDYPDRRIQAAGSAVRLRSYGDSRILTWKGPVQPDPELKIREEIETEVSSRKAAVRILDRLGLQPVLEYSKYRETYGSEIKPLVEVCLDETTAGCFIEIEGPREDISRIAEMLNLDTGERVRESYVELLGLACRRSGEPGNE